MRQWCRTHVFSWEPFFHEPGAALRLLLNGTGLGDAKDFAPVVNKEDRYEGPLRQKTRPGSEETVRSNLPDAALPSVSRSFSLDPRLADGGAVYTGRLETPGGDRPSICMSTDWEVSGPPPKGSGWVGVGPQLHLRSGYKIRPFEDGCGLCSPGRWPKGRRRLPDTTELTVGLMRLLVCWAQGECLELETLFFKLAAGSIVECPFPEHLLRMCRDLTAKWTKKQGTAPTTVESDVPQEFELRLLQAFLKACGDPDSPALDHDGQGVKIGADCQLPRTPAVFEAKRRWKLDYMEKSSEEAWGENYGSAKMNPGVLEEQFKTDRATVPPRMTRIPLA